ncbi:MAG: hypothetical protein HXX20_00945 [Chloroflexi bacterium]|nr:hypothetical protein [Chloroflexota bacterium]
MIEHGSNNPWNEDDLLEELGEGTDAANTAKKILDWAKENPRIIKDKDGKLIFGTGKENGTFSPKIFAPGTNSTKEERQIFTLNTVGGGKIHFIFKPGFIFDDDSGRHYGGGVYYDSIPPFNQGGSKRPELEKRLNRFRLEEVNKKGMSLSLAIFQDEAKLTEFFEIMEWVINEVSKLHGKETK